MPCWQQVKIEAAIRLKDRDLLQEVLAGLGAELEGQVIRKDGLRFQIGEDGGVSAEVTAAQVEAAESFLKALKREYALAKLTQWAKAQRFAVKRQGTKLKTRRWVT